MHTAAIHDLVLGLNGPALSPQTLISFLLSAPLLYSSTLPMSFCSATLVFTEWRHRSVTLFRYKCYWRQDNQLKVVLIHFAKLFLVNGHHSGDRRAIRCQREDKIWAGSLNTANEVPKKVPVGKTTRWVVRKSRTCSSRLFFQLLSDLLGRVFARTCMHAHTPPTHTQGIK